MNKYYFTIGALSDVGNVKKINQDNILVKIGEEDSGEFGLFVIADGMGGLAEGGTASKIAVSEAKQWWEEKLGSILEEREFYIIDKINKELSSLIHKIHASVSDYGRTIGDKAGTTLSLLFIFRDCYLLKHIGDSRIYIIRKDIRQISVDHSWVAEQVREGNLPKEAAKIHPGRNILTQCIGALNNIEVYEDKGKVEPGDTFILCSDGFHNYLEDDEMYNSIKSFKTSLRLDINSQDLQQAAAGLFEKVKLRGAADNASVIIVHLNELTRKKSFFQTLKNTFMKKDY